MEIRSLKDWCTALDEQSKVVERYEKQLTAFYKNLRIVPDYDTPFMTGCYNKEKFIGGALRGLPVNFGVSFAFAFVGWIIFLVKNLFNFGIKEFGNCAKGAILPAVIILVIFLLLGVGLKFLMYTSQKSSLKKMEKNLSGFMQTVPMTYRASDKMKTIAMVYFTKPNIRTDIILQCVDDYLRQAGRSTLYQSVMFDLPCECPFLDLGDSVENNGTQVIVDTNNPTKKRSEYLPKDIDTKICEGAKDSDKELHDMIGLESVKDQIEKFKNRIKFYGKESNNGCHLAFLGSAGTGKTTVARIVTKILYDLGYIKQNQYIEISGDYLCAGDTSRAMAIIEYAYGGVLFIDEAYLMEKKGFEVIGVLLKAMEDHRKDFVCILAGYEEQMTRLFATNEGFTSRVKHTIYFPDYNEDEMIDIFNYFVRNYNGGSYQLSDEAKPILRSAFTLEKKSKAFGNARTVRNAVDAIMDNYADRCIKENSNTHIITSEDVQLYADARKKILQHELKNASAADQLDEQIIRLSELKPRMKEGSTNPDGDLSNLVGLESFRKEIDILRSQKEFYNQTVHQKVLFIGDEGCGKSTLTRILTGYLYQLGYISENKYLEIPAELLKGSFVGHTAKRAQAIISYASGGVLYIKNYNMLFENTDNFAGEALSAINTAIQENTDVTIVLGDYASPGIDAMKSLFTMVYEFPTYDNNQLLQIFDSLVYNKGFNTTDEARNEVWTYLGNWVCRIRDVQSIFNNSVKQHIANFNGDESKKFLIEKEDLVFPTEIIPPTHVTQEEKFQQVVTDAFSNAITNATEQASNMVELQIEAIPDEDATVQKPKIKLNIRPKN